MKLIKKISEDSCGGAIGGGAVGCVAMPLFSQMVRQSKTTNAPVAPKVIKFKKSPSKPKKFKLGLKEAARQLFENDPTTPTPDFDTTEVIAKLKSLENGESQDRRDTVTFGLDDDENGLVRVTIKGEQAEEFEKALSAMLNNEEDDELPEIAELLYKMKDQFDIVDVEWPEVEEDEETDQSLSGEAPPAEGDDMGGDPGMGDMDLGDDPGMGDMGGSDAGAQDLLTQVIDMMKADAEARKADARAREAEAKNREAEAAIGQAHARVKQEEELLDMDTYNKNKKEEDKEAKRLAQLAQWRSDVSNDSQGEDDDFGLGQSIRGQGQPQSNGQENEERSYRTTTQISSRPAVNKTPIKKTQGGRVHPHDIARFILNRMK